MWVGMAWGCDGCYAWAGMGLGLRRVVTRGQGLPTLQWRLIRPTLYSRLKLDAPLHIYALQS